MSLKLMAERVSSQPHRSGISRLRDNMGLNKYTLGNAPPKREKKFVMSEAEKNLRDFLKQKKKITTEQGIFDWLNSMNTTSEDHRSEWEKKIQRRIGKKLGVYVDA